MTVLQKVALHICLTVRPSHYHLFDPFDEGTPCSPTPNREGVYVSGGSEGLGKIGP